MSGERWNSSAPVGASEQTIERAADICSQPSDLRSKCHADVGGETIGEEPTLGKSSRSHDLAHASPSDVTLIFHATSG